MSGNRKDKAKGARAQRRATRSAGKKAARAGAKAAGLEIPAEVAQDPAVLSLRLAAVEAALKNMVKVNTDNHQTISQEFFKPDAHLWVLKNMIQDIVTDDVMKTEAGEVDLPKYYERFNENQTKLKAEAAEKAKDAEAAEEPPKEEQPAGTEVFGGDADGKSTNGGESSEGREGTDQDVGEGGPPEDGVPPVPEVSDAHPGQP